MAEFDETRVEARPTLPPYEGESPRNPVPCIIHVWLYVFSAGCGCCFNAEIRSMMGWVASNNLCSRPIKVCFLCWSKQHACMLLNMHLAMRPLGNEAMHSSHWGLTSDDRMVAWTHAMHTVLLHEVHLYGWGTTAVNARERLIQDMFGIGAERTTSEICLRCIIFLLYSMCKLLSIQPAWEVSFF